MSSNRRLHLRPYYFEVFAVVNFAVAAIFLWRSRAFVSTIHLHVLRSAINTCMLAGVGVLLRSLVAMYRGERDYFRIVRSPGWLFDTLRIAVFASLALYTYAWVKLVVPLYRGRLYDQELWDLDRAIFGGLSPNILFLDLLSNPYALWTISTTYSMIFFACVVVGVAYFASEPSRRIRIAHTNGNATMWAIGAWIYMLVPALGPAYRFPDVWMAHDEYLGRTIALQAMLMRNYQDVIRAAHGLPHDPISLLFGIGAFPSLHVALQTFVFFWFRRLWKSGEVLFGIFLFTIFIGSVVTGWHYLVDSIAGFVLGLACFWVPARFAKLRHFLAMKRAR